jgi:hypothetical protein
MHEDAEQGKNQNKGQDKGKNNGEDQGKGAGQDQGEVEGKDQDQGRGEDKGQNPALPFGLTLDPDPDFKGGFTIREADGFALIGKGVSYRNIDLQVETLVGYGVKENSLTAEVIDTQGATKFIKVTKQPTPSKQPFSITWTTEGESKQNSAYTWVSLVGKE